MSPTTYKRVEEERQVVSDLSSKAKIYLVLENPQSSLLAFRTHVFICFCIVLATILATVETMPSFYQSSSLIQLLTRVVEVFLILIFTMEYILRVYSRSHSLKEVLRFIFSALGILDLAAFFPYYMDIFFKSSAKDELSYVFRTTILRLFRLFSVFRVFKHSSLVQLSIEVLIIAVKQSLDVLTALFLFFLFFVVCFSTLMYFAERGTWNTTKNIFEGPDGTPSSFDSIPAAFWFVIVTLTTTGIGDLVPKTLAGKLVSVPVMIFGILLIALPSIIVGRNFTNVWETIRTKDNLPNEKQEILNLIQTLNMEIQQKQQLVQQAMQRLLEL